MVIMVFDFNSMMDNDGIHPNDDGYENMASVYFNAMKRMPFTLASASDLFTYGIAGEILPDTLKVRALDYHGNGVPYVDVRFEVTSGDASVREDQPVVTDSLGVARSTIQLGAPGTIFYFPVKLKMSMANNSACIVIRRCNWAALKRCLSPKRMLLTPIFF